MLRFQFNTNIGILYEFEEKEIPICLNLIYDFNALYYKLLCSFKQHYECANYSPPILFLNILTAMASRMTPKNLRMTEMPEGPRMRSIKLMERRVM